MIHILPGKRVGVVTNQTTRDAPSTVVIVEDDTDLANLFALWLGPTYTVRVAHDCATACELFDATVAVALLDRQLPDGSGDEILTSIRDQGLDCRVAMVTGVEPSLDIIKMGFDEYLCKPVTEEELHDTVERLVVQAQYGDALTEAYALASKKALLQTHCSAGELADSEKFAELEARIEELDRELTQMMNTFSEAQIMAEFTRLTSEGVQG